MSKHVTRAALCRRNVLALALFAGLAVSTGAIGQATTGSIFGQAPVASGETVSVSNAAGLTRSVTVGAQGRYTFDNLPLGTYTVTLMKDGATVDSRSNVTLRVGGGTEVSFVAPGVKKHDVDN